MTTEQTLIYCLGFALSFSLGGVRQCSVSLRFAIALILIFLFLPTGEIDVFLFFNSFSGEIKNYSSIFKYSSIGAFHGVVLSLVFYSARLFSSWLISAVFAGEQRMEAIKITENFVVIFIAGIFFHFLDFYKLIFLFQNIQNFTSKDAQADIYSAVQLCFYCAFGFFVLYATAHLALYFMALIINRYLKNFFTGGMVSALNFSVLVMILSLSMYPMSSEIARVIEISFELIK